MTTHSPSSLGSALALEERLPLRWCPLESPPCDPLQRQQVNEDTLRVILSLDEHHHVTERHEEDAALAGELLRLESKLNLVLELVSQVLAHQLSLPPAVPVRLAAHRLEWQAASAAPSGSGIIELYASLRYPRPLFLPATIEGTGNGWVHAVFDDLGEPVQDLLEQLIFRYHRRQVAATRRAGASPDT